jgi:HAD superfamily hydrolase (TIGR01509 family)
MSPIIALQAMRWARAILFAVNATRAKQMAMIFDLDGVLIDSTPLHLLAWERYLAALGLSVENLERRLHGQRNSELLRDLIGGDMADDVIFRHGAEKERLFREMLLHADPGQYRMRGLMEFLERHANIPKAVGSNAEPTNVDFVLDRFGLRRFFRVTVDGMQVKRPKPFPDIYLAAAKKLAIEPSDCIVFEDSPTGAAAGLAAGMRVVGVETTETAFPGVQLQIKDFLDPSLEPWLAAQGIE